MGLSLGKIAGIGALSPFTGGTTLLGLGALGGSLGGSSPPGSPDYIGAANAQGQANLEAARVNARLNNPNVVNPFGTQNVTWNGDNPTITQTLSPEQQALYTQQTRTQGLLGGLGEQGAKALQGTVGKSIDFSGAPTIGSYDATRRSVIDAMMGRANEDYTKQSDELNSNLIASGIRPGTKAYDNAQQMIERSRNDARNLAEISGGNAASQAYNVDANRRQQAISELLAQRQVPLNEVNALMTGSQVSNPFAVPNYSQSASVAPAPIFGANTATGQYNTDLYNAKVGSQNSMTQGLFGLGAAGLMAMSDRRLKSFIKRIGIHRLGIGIYKYLIYGKNSIGVMAQEVLKVKPEAVITMPNGYLAVNYGAL